MLLLFKFGSKFISSFVAYIGFFCVWFIGYLLIDHLQVFGFETDRVLIIYFYIGTIALWFCLIYFFINPFI